MKTLVPDDGFSFGLTVFETIAVEDQTPLFLFEHLNRLEHSLKSLGIKNAQAETLLSPESVKTEAALCPDSHGVLKISVSEKNIFFSTRPNTYTPEQYQKGFRLTTSEIRRNETSPLTYHKTANYGDNILEKRRTHTLGFDEPVFLNSKGQLCEGATTNLFFIKDGRLFTPAAESGLLKGIIREYFKKHYPVCETFVYPQQIPEFDEIFVTNSLLGIMPVVSWDTFQIPSCTQSLRLRKEYLNFLSRR